MKGAMVRLQRMLKRLLLWLTCRHHILEVVLQEVFHVLMGPSSVPEVVLFKHFRNQWLLINKEEYSTVLDCPGAAETFDAGTRERIIKLAQTFINVSFDLLAYNKAMFPSQITWHKPEVIDTVFVFRLVNPATTI